MTKDDYFKYRIQGGDIYVLPENVFDELFDELSNLQQENKQLLIENQKRKEVIDKAIEYINEYAWQEDIIGDMYTTTGKPIVDKYMQLEWDNCNELLDILKEVE